MNTDIVSIDAITIEELLEKDTPPETGEDETLLSEVFIPARRRFGIVDLWKIRNVKRHFSIYR